MMSYCPLCVCQGGERALSCQDWEGRSPLHYAALSGDTQQELYTWLIQQGAPTNLKDKVSFKWQIHENYIHI